MKKIFDYTAQELFEQLNDSGESCWLEAKGKADICPHGRENFRTLLETVCSFSNETGLGGGIIVYGIGENSQNEKSPFVVEGIPDPDKAQLDIATQCKTVFNIAVLPQIRVEKIDGKCVLLVIVPEQSERKKPVYFKKDGLPAGAFRRIGSADLHCTEEDIRDFYQDTTKYDQIPIPGASVDEIDPAALNRYRVLRARVNPMAEELNYNDQELLEALGCVNPENKRQLNLAGVLLFGSYKLQRRTIPDMRIDYIRVPGNVWVPSPDDTFHSIDILGPQMLTVYSLVDAINGDLPKGFLLREGEIQADSTGFPVRALREAIVNAMMHRLYSEGRPTQIIRYDNRIEITNAGFSLKSTEELGTPGSKLRNKTLAPVFHDTGLAENKGSGIKRMREAMAAAHFSLPTFESSREKNEFTIRFLLHHFLCEEDLKWLAQFEADDLNDAQKTALIFVREVGAIDNLTYRQMNNADTLKASRELRAMRDAGLLVDRGRGSATYYKPGERLIAALLKSDQGSGETYHGEETLNTHGPVVNAHDESLNTHGQAANTHAKAVITHGKTRIPEELLSRLQKLKKREQDKTVLKELILELCAIAPMTKRELAGHLRRKEDYLKHLFLSPMIASGELRYLHPEMVKHPSQAYITNPRKEKAP